VVNIIMQHIENNQQHLCCD